VSRKQQEPRLGGKQLYSFFPLDELDGGAEEDPLDDPEEELPDDSDDGVDPDLGDELELLSLDGVDEEPLSDFPSLFVSVGFPCCFPSSPGRFGSLNLSE